LDNLAKLSAILSEYYKFIDVFSKAKAKVLISHHPYDLQINLKEEVTQLSVGTIYGLSFTEQKTLKKFINENLTTGFI